MFCCFRAYLCSSLFLVFAMQSLGSLPHVCTHGSVRLSGGGGPHLGDPPGGLQEDPLPGEPVRPVRPQLFSLPPGLSDHYSPTLAGRAHHVCSRIRMKRTRKQTTYPHLPPSAVPHLFTLYSPLSTKIVKPRISLSNLTMFVNQTLLTSLISTRLTS